VSESALTAAQSALLSELQPEVTQLLARVEAYLDKLARREKSLMAKAELQEGRLSQPANTSSSLPSTRAKSPGGGGKGAAATGSADLDAMRLQQLRLKKERLAYAVGRLELQAGQKQRQLRKSMAAV
jgi:DASH complex subunit SPC19